MEIVYRVWRACPGRWHLRANWLVKGRCAWVWPRGRPGMGAAVLVLVVVVDVAAGAQSVGLICGCYTLR